MSITIEVATSEQWDAGLYFFYQSSAELERTVLVQEILEAHEQGNFSLEQMLIARKGDDLIGVMPIHHQPDNTAFFWLPKIEDSETSPEVTIQLLQNACRRMEQQNVSYAQFVLTDEELDSAHLLLENGFEQLAQLSYLQRELSEPALPRHNLPVQVVTFEEESHQHRFAKLIEQTYEGSLDCPAFTNVRDGQSALFSHQHSGNYSPQNWLLFEVDGEDVGLILLNDHPDQSAWEIVYMGVSPKFRGEGFGRMLLQEGISKIVESERQFVLLAVDRKNHFATTIYEKAGFFPIANRTVFLRHFS